ncbi:MAG: hypothetical protein IJC01_00125, partial [Clostridia bacterium]|nr:hypothetical protein [Clostridia bacterium]
VKKKEYLLVILNGADAACADEVTEILQSYPGEVEAFCKIDGKTYRTGLFARKCKGLVSELKTLIDESNINFL